MSSKESYFEDEIFIIADSGEMPEVGLQSSIYFLSKDPDGPGLSLVENDLIPLKKAVIARYQTIILRDLLPENRKKSLYRGLARSAANWQRLKIFAEKEHLDLHHVRQKTAVALISFMKDEVCYVTRGGEGCCPDCSQHSLDNFAKELGLSADDLPCSWQNICCL